MADTKNTRGLYVEGAKDEAALKGAFVMIGINDAVVKVFKTGAIATIPTEKADAILATGTISIDGTDFKVTLPHERSAKPPKPAIPTARPQGKVVEKAKEAPKSEAPKAPVTVQPVARRVLPSRPPVGPSKDEIAEKRKQLDEREAMLNKRSESLGAKERWLDGREKAQLVKNGALAQFVADFFVKFYCLDEKDEQKATEMRRLITGSNAGVEVAITAVRQTLESDFDRAADEYKPEIKRALTQFLGEVKRIQSAANATNPASPKATIGEGQLAKDKDRKGDKAKRERNAPATTAAPASATASTTESTQQPAAPQ